MAQVFGIKKQIFCPISFTNASRSHCTKQHPKKQEQVVVFNMQNNQLNWKGIKNISENVLHLIFVLHCYFYYCVSGILLPEQSNIIFILFNGKRIGILFVYYQLDLAKIEYYSIYVIETAISQILLQLNKQLRQIIYQTN